jgi:hypothetical protein
MIRLLSVVIVFFLVSSKNRIMKIRIVSGNQVLTGVLYDNPSARDFASLLPLTLSLEDYNQTEKISRLPRKLNRQGAPEGHDPRKGDITYYAPWGNLALFYRDFRYSTGLVPLGRIDGPPVTLPEGTVRIEQAE